MLDDISLYWFTNSAASSARIYWQNSKAGLNGGKVDIPVAATIFPHEIYRAPRSWAERTYTDLVYWNEAPRGGHFAAFEQPRLFAEELRRGFAPMRKG